MDPARLIRYRPMQLPDVPCDGDMRDVIWDIKGSQPSVIDADDVFLWSTAQTDRIAQWEKIVARYEADPHNYVNAWQYLDSHPAFWMFAPFAGDQRLHERYLEDSGGVGRCFSLYAVRVSPLTLRIEDDEHLNTMDEVWIEGGKYPWPGTRHGDHPVGEVTFHDYALDTGGPTFETAFVRMAHNVATTYGHDRMVCDDLVPPPPATDALRAFDALMAGLSSAVYDPIEKDADAVRDKIRYLGGF
jgi:hypothetical protein